MEVMKKYKSSHSKVDTVIAALVHYSRARANDINILHVNNANKTCNQVVQSYKQVYKRNKMMLQLLCKKVYIAIIPSLDCTTKPS